MSKTDMTARGMSAKNTTDLTETVKQMLPQKVKLYSESIFGVGTFVPQFETALEVTSIQAIYGGSHISAALAETAEEIYIPANKENSIKYSNDFTQWVVFLTSVAKEVLPDGTNWNSVSKTDASSSTTGVYTDNVASCPITHNGVFVSFDLYIPPTETNFKDITVEISNRTNTPGTNVLSAYVDTTTLVVGKKYRIFLEWNKSDIFWAVNGTDVYRLLIKLNYRDTLHAPCTVKIKNVTLAWESILYEKYIGTKASYKTKETVSWDKINKNPYEDNYEVIVISYGRNEADESKLNMSHYYAYDKLISNCLQQCGMVIPTNPPPWYNTSLFNWDVTDVYLTNAYDVIWTLLMKKWNSGVDINSYFRSLTNASSIMADNQHQNSAGSALMITKIKKEIDNRKVLNNSSPFLSNKCRYYLSGIPTGTWTKALVDGVEKRLLNSNASYCMESSIQNNYLDFGSIDFRQLHLICQQGTGYGSVDVIIDEGTGNEHIINVNLNQNLGADSYRFHGHFIIDFGQSDIHTVKVLVKSNTKVRIHGIVAI